MRFVGLDPGKNGSVSWLWTDDHLGTIGYDSAAFSTMTETDLWILFKRILGPDNGGTAPVVLIEKQGTRPTDARKNIATLHHQYGMLRGMLIASEIPNGFEDIAPALWQKTFKLLMPKDTSSTVKKNAHKGKAQQLFPEIKVTLALCDSLLIAEYARRMYLQDRR